MGRRPDRDQGADASILESYPCPNVVEIERDWAARTTALMIVLILPRLRDPLEISVANALGRARIRQAIRLYGIGRDENKLTKKDQ